MGFRSQVELRRIADEYPAEVAGLLNVRPELAPNHLSLVHDNNTIFRGLRPAIPLERVLTSAVRAQLEPQKAVNGLRLYRLLGDVPEHLGRLVGRCRDVHIFAALIEIIDQAGNQSGLTGTCVAGEGGMGVTIVKPLYDDVVRLRLVSRQRNFIHVFLALERMYACHDVPRTSFRHDRFESAILRDN